ncbi:MAG: MBL fold metallo-hydrolase [Anaerolineae bacterium]|jgi:glyoxylase-like metal-dependent hydrolase (beta-lactamase superfamily II)
MSDLPSYLRRITVPTPFAVGPVNLYLAEGDSLTLVDTGPHWDPARRALREGLATLGYHSSDLGRIILTHRHSDHCGLAAELVEASGAEVLTHPSNFDELADYIEERAQRLAFYSMLMLEAGMPLDVMVQIDRARRGYGRFAQAVRPDTPLEDGMTVRLGDEDWEVLHTPGHSGGLVCLYQPDRSTLLSSDHLLRDISSNPIVEPPPEGGTERPQRLVQYIAQLERMTQLPLDVALPAHGPPITDPRELVASRLAFHEQRAQQILEALGEEEHTAYELTLELFPHLDPINRFLAISEVVGHLDWLEAREEASSQLKDRVRLWAAD